MSANTVLEHRHLRAVRRRDQQPGLRHQRQQPRRLQRDGLAAGVRPGDDQHASAGSAGCRRARADRHASSGPAIIRRPSTSRRMRRDRGISSGCRARAQLEAPVGRRSPAAMPSTSDRELRARLQHVELGRRLDGALAARRRGRGTRRSARAGCGGPPRASCCSSATMSLLISTVLSGSRNRLAPLPELPCTMPGIAVAVLGPDDEHVAAVAIGDDLLLQVLRRVLAAQVRLERSAQPRALLAQPVPDAPQLRTRVVHHLARRIDLAADVGDLALERRGARRRSRAGAGTAPRARRIARATSLDRSEKVGEREQLQRLRARGPRPRATSRIASRSVGRAERRAWLSARKRDRLGRRRKRGATARGSVERLQPREPLAARRGQREAADRLDDAIEFEGPQGACMHGLKRTESPATGQSR